MFTSTGGLPYESTPPPENLDVPAFTEPPALDRPLDDYTLPLVPSHVQSLMGRMGRGKVYLAEESPAILHLDGEEQRIRGDRRIADLAARLDEQDPTEWLQACSVSSPSPIRNTALFVRSELIQHLSTSKVFSWTTNLGAKPMGIEWLNDSTLLLLFSTPSSALLSLSLLSKAGFDPAEGDDPLVERSAHSIPISLLPMKEPDPVESVAGKELLGDEGVGDGAGDVIRKGRGTFGAAFSGAGIALEFYASEENRGDRLRIRQRPSHLASRNSGGTSPLMELAEGVDPNSRITIRYALDSDDALRKEAKQSEWYKRHGRHAGKEVAGATRRAVGNNDDEGISLRGRDGGDGGREFGKRIGKERATPYTRSEKGRRPGKTAEDLDKELERIASRRQNEDQGMDIDEDIEMAEGRSYRRGGWREGRGRGRARKDGGRREHRGKEDLDKELDALFATRSAGR